MDSNSFSLLSERNLGLVLLTKKSLVAMISFDWIILSVSILTNAAAAFVWINLAAKDARMSVLIGLMDPVIGLL